MADERWATFIPRAATATKISSHAFGGLSCVSVPEHAARPEWLAGPIDPAALDLAAPDAAVGELG